MENSSGVAVQVAPTAETPGFSGASKDIMADLALLQKEQDGTVETAVPEVQAEVPQIEAQPAQPDTKATATATVPEKFKAEDGSLDTAKLEKSTVDAEAALAKYAAKEKELRQKMNEVNNLSRQTIPPNVAPVAPAVNAVPLTAFEIQVANDLITEAAAYGYQMPQGQAIAQARVQVKMAEARHNAEASLTESLRVKLEDQDRRTELNAIAQYDQSVLSPEGFEALSRIREAKPWINQSPTPWTEAYNYYLAEQTRKSRQQGTVLPTPTGLTAKAPPTPVSPAPRAVVQSKGPNLASEADIMAHVKGLNDPKAEAAFWKSQGLKF